MRISDWSSDVCSSDLLQAQGRPLPSYEVIEESGPPHKRQFRVRASLTDGVDTTEAQGSSRRGADKDAARQLLLSLQSPHAYWTDLDSGPPRPAGAARLRNQSRAGCSLRGGEAWESGGSE